MQDLLPLSLLFSKVNLGLTSPLRDARGRAGLIMMDDVC